MKRIDRYVLGVFLPASTVALGLLTLLFLVFDFAGHTEDFVEIRQESVVRFALQYYAVKLPFLAYAILPAVPLMAAAWTAIRLAKRRELLPVVTGGTSLRRVYVPFFVMGLAAGAVGAAAEEWVLPRLALRLSRLDAHLRGGEIHWHVIGSDGDKHYFYAKGFDRAEGRLRGPIHWMELDGEGRVAQRVEAQEAVWEAGEGWRLFNGEVCPFLGGVRAIEVIDGRPRAVVRPIPPEGVLMGTMLSPEAIRWSADASNRFVPWGVAWRELHLHPGIPVYHLRVWAKVTNPLVPLLLLWIGLPPVVRPEERSFIRGTTIAFGLSLLGVGLVMLGEDLVHRNLLLPEMGTFGPVLILAVLGALSSARVRT